jgi:endonuclease YncB( thermonuclease family)
VCGAFPETRLSEKTIVNITRYKFIIAAALATLFFGVGAAQYATRSTISGVARIVDGDTVVVAGTVVRLKGVDAAELGTPRGENAKRVMLALITSELTCRLTGEKTHGREVGYCVTADGVDINQAIIRGCCVDVPAV